MSKILIEESDKNKEIVLLEYEGTSTDITELLYTGMVDSEEFAFYSAIALVNYLEGMDLNEFVNKYIPNNYV